MKNLIHNELRIKCEDPKNFITLRELLVAKDEYGSEYYTMKNLFPMPKGYDMNTGYTNYGEDWCWEHWGTKADVISDWIHDKGNQLLLLYHTISNPNDKWVIAFTNHLGNEFCPLFNKELPDISIEHRYYNLEYQIGGYFYWNTRYWGDYHHCGILEFASQHHPGLVNYLLDQENFREAEKENPMKARPEYNPNQVEENTMKKNNMINNEEKCQTT